MRDPQPEFNPVPGIPVSLAPGLKRVLAPNASPMTYRGTNTYFLGRKSIAVIDPGPKDPNHLAAILRAVPIGGAITHILLTHAHLDHSGLADELAHQTGAPIYAFGTATSGRTDLMQHLAQEDALGGGEGLDLHTRPTFEIGTGDIVESDDWRLEVLHLPGHMSCHLGFVWKDMLFCGDLVMGWSSSLISPPDGDMGQFMTSLKMLQNRAEIQYFPGHGAPIDTPNTRVADLLAHRRARRLQILEALSPKPQSLSAITRHVYHDLQPSLIPLAERNSLAHLIDLHENSKACASSSISLSTKWNAI